jgi:hypothetical protein
MVAKKKATKKKSTKKPAVKKIAEVLMNHAPAYQTDAEKRNALAEKIAAAL